MDASVSEEDYYLGEALPPICRVAGEGNAYALRVGVTTSRRKVLLRDIAVGATKASNQSNEDGGYGGFATFLHSIDNDYTRSADMVGMVGLLPFFTA